MTDLSHLRTLASRATKGPREADIASGIVWFGVGDAGDERECYDVWSENPADTELVAALSPDTVLRLLDVVEAFRADTKAGRLYCGCEWALDEYRTQVRECATHAALAALDFEKGATDDH